MIKVSSEVQTYKDFDSEPEPKPIHVLSHWNYNDRVWIEVAGKKVLVIGRDLIVAIQNAMNTARF